MRIIGGTLKGRTIECPQGIIRPAMDKMKETVFSVLGDLSGVSFLDLFSGSGSIALEALSRGADFVTLVEKDRGKIPTILKNVSIADRKIECKFMPAELFIKRNKKRFDIIFCDPPFPYNFHRELVASCAQYPVLDDKGQLLIHYPAERPLPQEISGLVRTDRRVFGRSIVDFYSKGEKT
ncbi:MAG: 16S rRNA (guanine(966)-N(2))-methyltransferase RsmD [Bacteroides sp.]|nr:16S rRNA (guanine(966)-N(2))-methyltransferase RsmD [Prevotella sp.]MCM1408212.1 16S rRNA (guanine(966)-N(2))-methyltransferase RsmD [Treponema brennaborense]MCM1469536.1 16S rRNA (guanine(966)-N(2))-methyltransferase RsmD [Bacteroides sp.]